MGLHTLCLLDIKVKEQTIENLMKGNKIYEKPRYMKTHQVTQTNINYIVYNILINYILGSRAIIRNNKK